MKKGALPLVLIVWADHWDDGTEWKDLDDEAKAGAEPLPCHSVGWVLSENAKMVKLIQNLDGYPDEANHGFGVMNILKAAILRRVLLKGA